MPAVGQKRASAKPQEYISQSSLLVFVDTIVSIVRQMESDMSKRPKQFLTFLLCAAIGSGLGCTTTTHRDAPSKTAMGKYEIGRNTDLINWYVSKDVPQIDPNEQPSICAVYATVAATIVNPAIVARHVITRRLVTPESSKPKSE